jgi:hypothetical protein
MSGLHMKNNHNKTTFPHAPFAMVVLLLQGFCFHVTAYELILYSKHDDGLQGIKIQPIALKVIMMTDPLRAPAGSEARTETPWNQEALLMETIN